MTDIISLECIAEADPGTISPAVYRGALIKALTAIKELVAERNHWEDDALRRAANTGYWRERAEKAEADLAAARAALEILARLGNGDIPGNSDGNVIAQQALSAIAAARAEGGE